LNIKYPIILFFLSQVALAQKNVLGAEASGKCSFYGDKFNGKKTYFGLKFDNLAFTAAHRSLPVNTILAVTNLANDSTVYVKITDRGPYSHGRLIDVSKAAAKQLNFVKFGIAKVHIRVIGYNGMRMLNLQDPPAADADAKNEQQ
jgi:rare lipoprotein A